MAVVNTTLIPVSNSQDDGTGLPNTLFYALTHSSEGQTIVVNLVGGATKLKLTGPLPSAGLLKGVNLLGTCTGGKGIILDGNGQATPNLLHGNNFVFGFQFTNFKGSEIFINTPGNRLMCVSALK